MKKLLLCSILFCLSCSNVLEETVTNNEQQDELILDHVVIFTSNPIEIAKTFSDSGFTFVPDSLSVDHEGQGTSGKVIYFLNMYIELLFINDTTEFRNSKFLQIAPELDDRLCGESEFPYGIAFKESSSNKNLCNWIPYHEKWMSNCDTIKVHGLSVNNAKIPQIFTVPLQMQNKIFQSTKDLSELPVNYQKFFTHPNRISMLTGIHFGFNDTSVFDDIDSLLSDLDMVTFKNGTSNMVTLSFDNQAQNKIIDLRPSLNLIIKF